MSPAIADELEIGRLLVRLAMAGDDRDALGYRECLFDWIDIAFPGELPELVRADDYTRLAIERLSVPEWTHHRPAIPLLVAGGRPGRISGTADFLVRMGWTDAQGKGLAATAGGRYHLGFIHKSDRWLICARSTSWRYHDGDPFPKLP